MTTYAESWLPKTIFTPFSFGVKQRNTVLDSVFYDVGSLSTSEQTYLVKEINTEGSILVVHPRGARGENGIVKFEDHAGLLASPGESLTHFTIAGVGSSDLGAAALARNVADYYGVPVGAVVAGYGVADLLTEALGGWFFLGTSNWLMKLYHDANETTRRTLMNLRDSVKELEEDQTRAIAERTIVNPDSDALLKLFLDEERTMKRIVAHSKGCLSVAYALEALVLTGAKAAAQRAKRASYVTLGSVVELPHGYANVFQFLGELDWFGALNSRRDVDHDTVTGAWHHLNPMWPASMKVAEVLDSTGT